MGTRKLPGDIPVKRMIESAFAVLSHAYAPYSGFKVGAALLTADGQIYTGCNVENAALSPGNCAERTAVFKAVSEGRREFRAVCIVNEDSGGGHDICPPCGVCRQVLMEFARPDEFWIILATDTDSYETYTLAELLPLGFGPGSLK